MKKRIKLTFLLLTFLLSHSKTSAQEPAYLLPIDPIADLFSFMSQPISEEGKDKLAMFSYNENALLLYDLETRKISQKIKYDNQGPKALNNMKVYGGLKYINADSIVYYDTQLNRLYITDNEANVYQRLLIDGGNIGFGSSGIRHSLAYRKGHLYVQAWPITVGQNMMEDYKAFPNHFGKIDLKDGRVERLLFDFPASYEGKDYSQMMKSADIIYNPNIDKFIINFPSSHSIYVTDFNGYAKSYKVQSELVSNFEERKDHKGKVEASSTDSYTTWLSDQYERLIFDPKSGFYFRIARKGISERAFKERDLTSKKEVMVLDENFNHIMTLKHHGGSFMYYFFKGNEIFWNKDLRQYNLDAGNEDILYFDRTRFK